MQKLFQNSVKLQIKLHLTYYRGAVSEILVLLYYFIIICMCADQRQKKENSLHGYFTDLVGDFSTLGRAFQFLHGNLYVIMLDIDEWRHLPNKNKTDACRRHYRDARVYPFIRL